ncbi:MAG: glycosyltransferase [Candidatus Eisenbacteria bacterium]|nr:glycosyltransferase [Candidatus Eisenbacteria bacterium]
MAERQRYRLPFAESMPGRRSRDAGSVMAMRQIWMIAFTHYNSDPRVRREAEALAAAGHRVRVLALRKDNQVPRERVEGVEVIRLPLSRRRGREVGGYLRRYALFFLLAFWHTTSALFSGKIDLVHVHTMPDLLVFAALLPRLLGKPVILDVHDMMPELYRAKFGLSERSFAIRLLRWQERLATAFASRVIAVHEPHLAVLRQRGTPARKATVIMNLPDERIFSRNGRPAPAAAADRGPGAPYRGPGAPYRLIYHGTLAPRHGVRTAILACARLREEMPRLSLQIVGDGEERANLIELVRELQLEERVSFSNGALPVDRLPAVLAEADLGLVPGRIDPSTDLMLPTKLLEYLRMRIPVVCSPLRAVQHYFGRDGLTYAAPSDTDAWADAIRRHARDASVGRAQLAGVASFLTQRTWSAEKRRLLDLYRSC